MVMKKPKGLGLGLEALLGPRARDPGEARDGDTPHNLKLSQLQAGKYQPRIRMDEGALYDLAASIKAQGVMQPILVRKLTEDRYEIIAGERRMRAAELAGLDSIPVLVRAVSDESAAAMALIENIQRENLNPLEEAQGISRLVTDFGMSHEQAALAVGRSRSAASNLLRLLQLSEPVQQLLLAGDIDMGHARALLPLDGAQQVALAHQIVARKLTVRDAERMAAAASVAAPPQTQPSAMPSKPADLLRIEQELSDLLTTSVEIRLKKRASAGQLTGEVVLGFHSLDALNAVIERLGYVNG